MAVNRRRLRRMGNWTGDPADMGYRHELLARPEFRDGYAIDLRAPAQQAYTVFRRRD